MNSCPVYILAGGRSTRMGADKATMAFGDVTLLQQMLRNLEPVASTITVVSSLPLHNQGPWRCIPDAFPEAGPAGGIAAALMDAKDERIFITACDMPLVDAGLLLYLLEASVGNALAVPVADERWQPLAACYHGSMAGQWCELVQAGERKLQQILRFFDPELIHFNEPDNIHIPKFANVNTPEELRSLLNRNT